MTTNRLDETSDERSLLESWLAEWYAPAYRTAVLILGDRSDAEDAVQDAFLRLWRFRASIPTGDSARAWLYRVVVNACFSRVRSERRHRGERADLDEIADRRPGPEESSTDRVIHEAVRAAIESLPEPLRVPVVLHYYAGLTEREIALVIRRRHGTVKSRLHEARRRLETDPAFVRLTAHEEAE